jgi:hypothetical protein
MPYSSRAGISRHTSLVQSAVLPRIATSISRNSCHAPCKHAETTLLNASLIDVPRPFIDPINTFVEALGITSMALQRPRIDSTIALLLDKHRRGLAMFRIPPLSSRTIHSVVAHCSEMPSTASVVLVSSRRNTPVVPADIPLLHICTSTLAAAGIRLFDWAVIGTGGLHCPRTLAGVPDPWPEATSCL